MGGTIHEWDYLKGGLYMGFWHGGQRGIICEGGLYTRVYGRLLQGA